MKKNVLIIQGGGRVHGNTSKLVNSFVQGLEKAGHAVEIVSLNTYKVNGCLGCNMCRYQKPCVQKDDFSKIAGKIEWADCLTFASPLYFWTISSKLKALIERFYSIAKQDTNPPFGRYEKYPKKDCVLLMSAADNFFWTFEQAVSYYKFTLVNYIGFEDKGMYLAGGCGSTNGISQIEKTKHLENVYKMGEHLYE